MSEKKELFAEKTISVAVHEPSGCLLINGRWEIDPSEEDIITGGKDNYEDYSDIVSEDDDNYDPDDDEQEHDDEYSVREYHATIMLYPAKCARLSKLYSEDEENYEEGRDRYYGWAMNGGGGRKEFRNMYGDGNYLTKFDWYIHNYDCDDNVTLK